jgi:hypothetical protein
MVNLMMNYCLVAIGEVEVGGVRKVAMKAMRLTRKGGVCVVVSVVWRRLSVRVTESLTEENMLSQSHWAHLQKK